jgi:hypothetical protein
MEVGRIAVVSRTALVAALDIAALDIAVVSMDRRRHQTGRQ